jgi:hypothetical protein
MGPEPKKWIGEFDALVRARAGFLILVTGATSLEPLAERLQPERRRSERAASKRHFLRRPGGEAATHHVTARYAVAARPLLPLVVDAYVSDLERLDRGQDPVGDLRFGARKSRREYLNRTAGLAVPDPAVNDRAELMVPLIEEMVPLMEQTVSEAAPARLVFLMELEPATDADWSDLLDIAPSQLPDRAGLAVADPDRRLFLEAAPTAGTLVIDASDDPEFQRPKRGDRPVRAGLGVEPKRPAEEEPPPAAHALVATPRD